MNHIAKQDPEVWAAVEAETARQQHGLEMIASENYTSPAIMQCLVIEFLSAPPHLSLYISLRVIIHMHAAHTGSNDN